MIPPVSTRRAAAAVFGKREDDKIAWRARTEHDSAEAPSLSPQGHLLLSDGKGLVRVDPDGTVAWRQPHPQWTPFRPAAAADGGAVWAPGGRGVQAYDPKGQPTWSWGPGMQMLSIQPTVGPDGTVYVCVRDEQNHARAAAVAPGGELRWMADLPMGASAPPLLHADGRVTFRIDDDRLASFDASGEKVWERALPERVDARPAAGPDGSVWIGNSRGQLWRIDPDGEARQVFQAVGEIRGAPRVEEDGRVLFTTMRGFVYCVSAEGEEIWSRNLGGILESSVSQLPDGTYLVGAFEKKVYGLTPEGQVKWDVPLDFAADQPIAVDDLGTAYLAGGDQVLALRPGGLRVDLEQAPEPEAGDITTEGGWLTVGGVSLPIRP